MQVTLLVAENSKKGATKYLKKKCNSLSQLRKFRRNMQLALLVVQNYKKGAVDFTSCTNLEKAHRRKGVVQGKWPKTKSRRPKQLNKQGDK